MTAEGIDDRGIQPGHGGAEADRVAGRVRRYLLPLLFCMYLVSYLDRVNVGFAALPMNAELGLSARQYGLLSGIFFWGYFLFEVPSNLILHRVGARAWIARILITWGTVAAATGFVQSATQLYLARFVLGLAEAGFFPGVLYYLTLWFRRREQAEAIGWLLTALPAASILGGPLSGWILDSVHWLGVSAWRWLLVLEALPAILLGFLTLRCLPDEPSAARFLTASEQAVLQAALADERTRSAGEGEPPLLRVLLQSRVLQRVAIHFLLLMALYLTGFWMPQSIRLHAAAYTNTAVGFLIVIPNALSLVTMVLVARHSDRTGERRWHAALPLVVAGACLYQVGSAETLAGCVALWSFVAMGVAAYLGPFWAATGEMLSGRAAAAGFALINALGSLGSFLSLSVVGAIAARTGSLDAGFRVVAVALGLAAVLLLAGRSGHAGGDRRAAPPA